MESEMFEHREWPDFRQLILYIYNIMYNTTSEVWGSTCIIHTNISTVNCMNIHTKQVKSALNGLIHLDQILPSNELWKNFWYLKCFGSKKCGRRVLAFLKKSLCSLIHLAFGHVVFPTWNDTSPSACWVASLLESPLHILRIYYVVCYSQQILWLGGGGGSLLCHIPPVFIWRNWSLERSWS